MLRQQGRQALETLNQAVTFALVESNMNGEVNEKCQFVMFTVG